MAQSKNKKVKLESLFTQKSSDGGEWVNIVLPHDVDASIDLKILGADSFEYRSKLAEANRVAVNSSDMSDEKYNSPAEIEKRHIAKCELLNCLVVDWKGFDQDFTPELSLCLLINSPFVLLKIDQFAAQRINFMKRPVKK